jgi:hypothetical protein
VVIIIGIMLTFHKLIDFIRSKGLDENFSDEIKTIIDLLLENRYSKEFSNRNIEKILKIREQQSFIFFAWRLENPSNFPYHAYEVRYFYTYPLIDFKCMTLYKMLYLSIVEKETFTLDFLLSDHDILGTTLGDFLTKKILDGSSFQEEDCEKLDLISSSIKDENSEMQEFREFLSFLSHFVHLKR